MSNGSLEFPQQIVEDILSRLPVKSLCRFKCVSKPWRTLISDPHFAKTHLARHKKERLLLQTSQSQSLFSLDFEESSSDHNTVAAKELELGFQSAKFSNIWGSCNGLVLLTDIQNTLVLLNPSTRLYKKLPLPSRFYYDDSVVFGFGYDSSADDYKVVKIINDYGMPGDDDIDYYILPSSSVFVYSVKFGTWKKCAFDPTVNIYLMSPGVFVNGLLHWFAQSHNGSNVIAAFDLATERFSIVTRPSSLEGIACVGGCLCLYDVSSNCGPRDVWVMKEYGKVESWTKFSIFNPKYRTSILSLFLLNDGCFLVLSGVNNMVAEDAECKWAVLNKEGEIAREIEVNGLCGMYRRPKFSYVESLVSPIPINFIQRQQDDRFGQATNVNEVFAASLRFVEETLSTTRLRSNKRTGKK